MAIEKSQKNRGVHGGFLSSVQRGRPTLQTILLRLTYTSFYPALFRRDRLNIGGGSRDGK